MLKVKCWSMLCFRLLDESHPNSDFGIKRQKVISLFFEKLQSVVFRRPKNLRKLGNNYRGENFRHLPEGKLVGNLNPREDE